MSVGIVILFPGTGYTCAETLLVECSERYEAMGYAIVKLDFSGIPFREIATIGEAFERAKGVVLGQLRGIEFAAYEDILFISKSFGTVCAGWLEGHLGIRPRQLYLTPLEQTLPFVKPASRVTGMVIGTRDRLMDSEALADFCAERRIPCLVVDGVGHNLKMEGDAERTAEINGRILEMCTVR
jgi:hypothetical protein